MTFQYTCRICGVEDSVVLVDNVKDWEYGFEGAYDYRKCLSCSSVQLHPFPALDDLIEAYKVDYHGYAPPTAKGFIYSFLYRLVEWVTFRKIKKLIHRESPVLDVGCGIGLFLNKLKSLGYRNIEGVDFSAKAAQALNGNGIKCHLGTFLALQKENRTYDLIVMNNYLEHTLNPLEELKKAASLLKENGVLLGEVPNFDAWDRLIFGRFWGGNHVPRHTFQFNAKTLKYLLKQAGFNTVEITYPLNTSHFALSIQNFFQRNCADLKNNKKLVHGRAKYYPLLMMGLAPVSMLSVLFGKTGFMRFRAANPKEGIGLKGAFVL